MLTKYGIDENKIKSSHGPNETKKKQNNQWFL